MPVSTQHEVVQYAAKKGEKAHPNLKPGDYHLKGTLEAAGPGELCPEGYDLASEVISLARTAGGGIAYEFAIRRAGYSGPERRVLAGESPTGAERRGVVAPANGKSSAKFNKRLNVKAH